MKNRRLRKYLEQKASRQSATQQPEDRQKNPPRHTNQDFNGYPHAPAKEEIISPTGKEDRKTASVDVKDGEKMTPDEAKRKSANAGQRPPAQDSDGSGGAFNATEEVKE